MERNWKLVSVYYKLKSQIKEIRGKSGDYCVICALDNCDHIYPKQPQDEVFEILNYFADAILTQSRNAWHDTEREIIKWPEVGNYNHEIEYVQIPAFDLPFAWVHKDKHGLIGEVGGVHSQNLIDFVENYSVSDGTYFGYWTGSEFYLLRAFRDGEWIKLQRFNQIPNADDIKIEDGLPIKGFWYIPLTSDPYNFAINLTRV